MKCKFIVCLPCVALILFISSCGDKKSAESPAVGEMSDSLKEEWEEVESANPEMDEQDEQIKEIQKQQKVAPIKEEEVRDVAGLAKHLAKNTEMFFNAQIINGLIGSMRGSKIGQLMEELAEKEGDDINEMMKSDDFQEFLNIAGEEVFISMGDNSAKSLKTMSDFYSVYYSLISATNYSLCSLINEFLTNDIIETNLSDFPAAYLALKTQSNGH